MAGKPMEKSDLAAALPWLLGLIALMAAAALAPGASGFVGLCLIAWPAAAWMYEKQGWPGFTMLIMSGLVGLFCLDGKLSGPMALWCLGGMIALIIARVPLTENKPCWQREGKVYGVAALLSLVAVILCLQRSYPGGIAPGIAADLIRAVDAAPNSAELLYAFNQMGLVPLDSSMTLVTQGADGVLYMTEEVRLQLLYGLHSRLEEAMVLALPAWSVYLTALTTLLCVMLPVTARRRRGEKDDTPRFEKWHLPREIGLPIGCLFAGGLLPVLTDAAVIVTLGQLMSSVASVVFGVLGAAVLRFASKMAGRRGMITWVMILLAAVCVPQLLMCLGVMDQLMDMRKLRKINESEDDRV